MTQPEDRDRYSTISVVEDLDPEPVRGRPFRMDLLLGVPLLLAVILFAGWQWWRQEYQADQYRAGQTAVEQSDWDSALHYFREASGYSDADARAENAKEKARQRDHIYLQAVAFSQEEKWLIALHNIREVNRIEPDYRDSEALEQDALDHIYGGILSGTVTLRTTANPPGLYYRTPGGLTYLAGSDIYSLPRASIVDGQVVYDAPNTRWNPSMRNNDSGHNSLAGRHLVYARHLGGGEFDRLELSLDPTFYTNLQAGTNGLWGMHYQETGSDLFAASIVHSDYLNTLFAYQPYTKDGSATIGYAPVIANANSVFTGNVVVDIDTSSNLYLMANWSNASLGGVTNNTVINLYSVEAGQNTTRLVYTDQGSVLAAAQFSPDGRYVLAHTARRDLAAGTVAHKVVLIDLNSPSSSATLFEANVSAAGYPVGRGLQVPVKSWVGASFVKDGPRSGQVVVGAPHEGGQQLVFSVIEPLLVFDTDAGNEVVAQAMLDTQDDTGTEGWTLSSNGDEILIYGTTFARPRGYRLKVVSLDEDNTAEVSEIKSESRFVPSLHKLDTDTLVWTNFIVTPTTTGQNYSVGVFHAENTRQAEVVTPSLPYEQTMDPMSDEPWVSILLGDRFFAYAHDGGLHLRSYDGANDLLIEPGVTYVTREHRDAYYSSYMR